MKQRPRRILNFVLLLFLFIPCSRSADSASPESPPPAPSSSEMRQYRNANSEMNFLEDTSSWSWGKLEGRVRVSIRMEKEQFTFLEPVFLLIACKNLTNEDRLFGVTHPRHMFQVRVEDSEGHSVPLTRSGTYTEGRRVFSSYAVRLEPNGALGYVMDLRRTFDLTVPGRYSVQVSTQSVSSDRLSSEEVISNTTEFELKSKGLPRIHEFLEEGESEEPAATTPHSTFSIDDTFEEFEVE